MKRLQLSRHWYLDLGNDYDNNRYLDRAWTKKSIRETFSPPAEETEYGGGEFVFVQRLAGIDIKVQLSFHKQPIPTRT
jgi:hypothetical protein